MNSEDKAAIDLCEAILNSNVQTIWPLLRRQMNAVIAIAKRSIHPDESPVDKWPKWYVHRESKYAWYLKRISATAVELYTEKGLFDSREWSSCEIENTESGIWIEVTEDEALARITPVEQVESPDDWVTQDRVPARPGIDERAYESPRKSALLWQDAYCIDWVQPAVHGTKINGDTLLLRCRRKDLPKPVPVKTTRTVTFRKWICWDYDGREKIMQIRDGLPVKNWMHCHDTGETETYEVPL